MSRNRFTAATAALFCATTMFAGVASAATITQYTSASQLNATDTKFASKDPAGTVYNSPSVSFNNGNDQLTFSRRTGSYETDRVGFNYGDSAFSNGTVLIGAGGFQGPGDGGPISLTFSVPVTEFGLNIEDFDLAGNGSNKNYAITFSAFGQNGDLLGSFVSTPGCGNNTCLSFEGLSVSGGGISSITFSDNTAGSSNNLLFGNVAYGFAAAAPPASTVTPEPSSIALLGTGLVSLAAFARRARGFLNHRSLR